MRHACRRTFAFLAMWGWVMTCSGQDVRWLVEYRADSLPQKQGWTPVGAPTAKAEIANHALRIADDADNDTACFRAAWKAEPDHEIIVETRARFAAMKAWRGGTMFWPWRDGAPIGLLVSDGKHQDGLALRPQGISTFRDRFAQLNTSRSFHTYRLVIRGNDISVDVDGERKIQGRGAFCRPADSAEPFIQFGSNSKAFTSESFWEYVRLGVRRTAPKPAPPRLKVKIGEPWEITRTDKVPQTRPYLYDMGNGLLLMSIAQGPDAYYEPYGVLKSTDEGKTWKPIKELDQDMYAPLPMLRLKDGSILGVSRWNKKQEDGVYIGRSVRLDARADRATIFENRIDAPPDTPDIMVFDRHIFDVGKGMILAAVYDKAQRSCLFKTTDEGRTWSLFSTIGKGGEPAVARLSGTAMTAILRQGTMMPFEQVWSQDGGKTWSPPTVLEEGSVDADLCLMSNGVLACSYGRPGSNIMFSLDQGKTWTSHRVISDEVGYNYTTLRKIRPGRLLYIHDAPKLKALYVDVERLE